MAREINILFYLDVLKKHAKTIVFLIFLAAMLSFFKSSSARPMYSSRVSILLVRENDPLEMSVTSTFNFNKGSLYETMGSAVVSMFKSRAMRNDVYSEFKELKKRGAYFRIEALNTMSGILLVEVKTHDPELSSRIANFCASNLDKLNKDLEITFHRPMVKVLDPAIPPEKECPRYIGRKMTVAAIFAFFAANFMAFISEYYSYLKRKKRKEGLE